MCQLITRRNGLERALYWACVRYFNFYTTVMALFGVSLEGRYGPRCNHRGRWTLPYGRIVFPAPKWMRDNESMERYIQELETRNMKRKKVS